MITKPLKNLKLEGLSNISQPFGETNSNMMDYYKNLGFKGHTGEDFVKPRGSLVLSATDGSVMKVQEKENEAGIYVRIMSKPIIFDGKEALIETCYFHLLDVAVEPNQIVEGGDIVGHLDSTGFSTGDHLHFGIRPYYKNKNGVWQADMDNGYRGYVDPHPHLLRAKEPMSKLFMQKGDNRVYVEIDKNKYLWIQSNDRLDDGIKAGWWGDRKSIRTIDKIDSVNIIGSIS